MRIFGLLFLFFLAVTVSVHAAPDLEKTTGLDWLQLSMGERMQCILASMVLLDQNGVALTKSPNDYHNAVSDRLRADPGLYGTAIPSILASVVYESEPQSREALDKIRKTT